MRRSSGWLKCGGGVAAGVLFLLSGVAGGVPVAVGGDVGDGVVVGGAGGDVDRAARAERMIERAVVYLRSRQDPVSGGWGVPAAATAGEGGGGSDRSGFHLPAVTGLVLTGMLMDPGIGSDDASVRAGLGYVLRFRQADGGVYDRILPSYNTAVVLSALARVEGDDEIAAMIPGLQDFLRGLQYGEGADASRGGGEAAMRVGRDHPFYGGVGYGRHGRPDNSNLTVVLQALHDSGVSADDPAFERALVFLTRTQMHESVNPMPWAKGSRQGGLVYSTVESAESVEGPAGQSMAGMIEETMDDGTVVSRLRAYGSMTYAGFKSFAFAGLTREDERVRLAWEWIRQNYTVEENPGLGNAGYYYYVLTFSRALTAWDESVVEAVDGKTGEVLARDWRNDLIDRLWEMQEEDGAFRSVDERWMEGDSVLITAYALISLQHAVGNAR